MSHAVTRDIHVVPRLRLLPIKANLKPARHVLYVILGKCRHRHPQSQQGCRRESRYALYAPFHLLSSFYLLLFCQNRFSIPLSPLYQIPYLSSKRFCLFLASSTDMVIISEFYIIFLTFALQFCDVSLFFKEISRNSTTEKTGAAVRILHSISFPQL